MKFFEFMENPRYISLLLCITLTQIMAFDLKLMVADKIQEMTESATIRMAQKQENWRLKASM